MAALDVDHQGAGMNRLSLRLVDAELEGGESCRAIQISIDGTDLIDLAREAEHPFALREGHPTLAGAYAWVTLSPEALLALQGKEDGWNGKASLLQCTCGSEGCWPLLARVSLGESEVVWSEFEQPHRGTESAGGHWVHDTLGPFTFERSRYDEEMRAIA
ncbi:MAG: hypothetical protein ABW190_16010 [Rhizobacter sp.]